MKKKKTILDFMKMMDEGKKWTMAIAYDYPWAKLIDETDIDMLFCGDSLGMCQHGYTDTLPVTLEQMIDHGAACRRGAPNTHLMVDLPFGSYQQGPEQAVASAVRLVKETGCDSIKIEGGAEILPQIKAISDAGIVVVAHLGLMPSKIAVQGGYKVQGANIDGARTIIRDSIAAWKAGAHMIGLEGVPMEVCNFIQSKVSIPVQTCQAGGGNLYDAFHFFRGAHIPKFAYQTEHNFGDMIYDALVKMDEDVKTGKWPSVESNYKIKETVSAFDELFKEFE